MRRQLLRAWLIAPVTAWCLSGCSSTPPKPAYPSDPLLISQKPIERKLENSAPQLVVHAEPTEQPIPIEALVAQPARESSLTQGPNDPQAPKELVKMSAAPVLQAERR